MNPNIHHVKNDFNLIKYHTNVLELFSRRCEQNGIFKSLQIKIIETFEKFIERKLII